MKVKLKNTGPIKEADIELGQFTVICGNNNTGKTYLAYVLYTIFQQYQESFIDDISSEIGDNPEITDAIVSQLNNHGEVTIGIDINDLVSRSIKLSNQVIKRVSEELHEIFNGDELDFLGASLSARFNREQVTTLIEKKLEVLEGLKLRNGLTLKYIGGTVALLVSYNKLEERNHAATRTGLSKILDEHLLWHRPARPVIFTSQRVGVSLFHSELDLNRHLVTEQLASPTNDIKPSKHYSKMKKFISKYSKPISDEITFVRNLGTEGNDKDGLTSEATNRLLTAVEDITSARYELIKDEIVHKSKPKAQRKFDIPLHMASASSMELMELYFYLKQYALEDDLLIIDEPESHLSHHNQINMVRLFCKCLSAGLNVLITTHSEIILKEINNLIMFNRLPEKYRKKLNKVYAGLDGIDGRSVKAYYCDEGNVEQRDINRWGIDFPKFDIPQTELDDRAVALVSLLERTGHD